MAILMTQFQQLYNERAATLVDPPTLNLKIFKYHIKLHASGTLFEIAVEFSDLFMM
jgi:hypothetical protein